MIKNFFWALINSGSGALVSVIPISIISRYINPTSFIELSTLMIISSLGNIIIDYGHSQKCYLKKNISEKLFRLIESYMLFRTIIFILIILTFSLLNDYFLKYHWFVIFLIFSSSFVSFINFRPNYTFNKKKLFKLKTKYSFLSSIFSSILVIITTIFINPNLGYVFFILLNPIFLGIFMRNYLRINFPKLIIKTSLSFKKLFKLEFIYQLIENIDDLTKRLVLQNNLYIEQLAIYLRNESFLFSPFKIINKSFERVILASWGPKTKLNNKKLFLFSTFIVIGSIFVGIFFTIFGNNLSIFFLGDQWSMKTLLFALASFYISMKIIGTNLGNLVKVKSKNFKLVVITSFISSILPLVFVLLFKITNITLFILMYCLTALLKNFVLSIYLIN